MEQPEESSPESTIRIMQAYPKFTNAVVNIKHTTKRIRSALESDGKVMLVLTAICVVQSVNIAVYSQNPFLTVFNILSAVLFGFIGIKRWRLRKGYQMYFDTHDKHIDDLHRAFLESHYEMKANHNDPDENSLRDMP